MCELIKPGVLIPLIIQIVLAAVALWYTIETRRLRQQGEMQNSLLLRQHFVQVTPYLMITPVPKKKIDADVLLHPEKLGQPAHVMDNFKTLLAESGDFLMCSVENITPHLALEIEAIHYDSANRHFVPCFWGLQVLRENEAKYLWCVGPPKNQDEALRMLANKYGVNSIPRSALPYQEQSYVMIMYVDVDGVIHLMKREYHMGHDGDLMLSRIVSGTLLIGTEINGTERRPLGAPDKKPIQKDDDYFSTK